MARNSSGTHSLPAGNPVTTGTTITSSWANTTLNDLSDELTDSLSRSGKGGMSAPLRVPDGAVGAPTLSFTSETNSGWYRSAAGVVRLAILGVYRLLVNATGLQVNGTFEVSGAATHSSTTSLNGTATFTAGNKVTTTSSNASLTMEGNRDADDSGTDLVLKSTATRSAGRLLEVQNNSTAKFGLDSSGEVSLQGGLECGFLMKTDADQTDSSGAGGVNITGLSFAVQANAGYVWELVLDSTGTGASSACRIIFTGPGSPTRVRYGGSSVATSFGSQTAGGSIASEAITVVHGQLQNGVNAGTVQAQFIWNGAGTSATCHKGTYLRWRRIY